MKKMLEKNINKEINRRKWINLKRANKLIWYQKHKVIKEGNNPYIWD